MTHKRKIFRKMLSLPILLAAIIFGFTGCGGTADASGYLLHHASPTSPIPTTPAPPITTPAPTPPPTTPTPTPLPTTPAPTPAPTLAPAQTGYIITAPAYGRRGEILTIHFQGEPNAVYNLQITSAAGNPLTAAGLGDATTDADGLAIWSWRVGGNTAFGTQLALISNDNIAINHEINIIPADTPEPPATGYIIDAPDIGRRGDTLSIIFQGEPYAQYHLQILSAIGNPLAAAGLGYTAADNYGIAKWSWFVGSNTSPGIQKATITGESNVTTHEILIVID